MNLVAFGLILICCHAWAIKIDDNFLVKSSYKTKAEDILENIKSILRNGDSSLGLPVLDPFIVERVPIKYNDTELNIEAYLPYAKVDGLSSYNVNSADFKLLRMRLDMDLSWPLVVATANYSLKGNVSRIDVYGNGEVNVAAHDFHFKSEIKFALKSKHVQVTELTNTQISLKTLDLHVTGIYNNEILSEIISDVISDMVPKLIDKYQKMIVDKVNNIIMVIANNFLSTKTLEELLKILEGLS